jgi:hypothetical protein
MWKNFNLKNIMNTTAILPGFINYNKYVETAESQTLKSIEAILRSLYSFFEKEGCPLTPLNETIYHNENQVEFPSLIKEWSALIENAEKTRSITLNFLKDGTINMRIYTKRKNDYHNATKEEMETFPAQLAENQYKPKAAEAFTVEDLLAFSLWLKS